MEMTENQSEIVALKSLLEDSDYVLYKHLESLLLCATVEEMQEVLLGAYTERGDLIEKRQIWREKINQLEQE